MSERRLEPWQQEMLDRALAYEPEGRRVYTARPRQYGRRDHRPWWVRLAAALKVRTP